MWYRGMGHMGNGVQGYGAHRQWGTGCSGMGHMYGQWDTGVWGTGVWGTWAMGHIGNLAQSAMGTGGMGTWATGHMEQ